MPFNVLDTINVTERLNFSQNFTVARPTVLDTLFPDVKSQHFKAEYYRLMQGQNLPTPAYVHALDTEAHIGRLSESVVTRTKIAKGQVMSRGIMKIKENSLDMTIDFGVPTEQKITFGDWSNPEYDIFGDIQKAVKIGKDQGKIFNYMLTSDTQVQRMRKNKSLQTAIYGGINVGKLVTMAELRATLVEEFGLTLFTCDEQFAFVKADGSRANQRYFDENKVTFFSAGMGGRVGTGLWGPTPEEGEYAAYQAAFEKMFVTVTMWATEDPVAKWTKASGMFIPVLPDPYGMVIATVTVTGE